MCNDVCARSWPPCPRARVIECDALRCAARIHGQMTGLAFAGTLAAMSMRTGGLLLGLALAGCDPKPTPEAKPETKAATPTDVKDVKTAADPGTQPPTKRGPTAKGKDVQLEKAPEAARKTFWAAIQAGRKQTVAKDYVAAVASYTDALAALPEHPRALSGRGYARLLAGDLGAAEADLRRALAAPGTRKLESAIVFNLGLVAEKRGDMTLARTQFSRANALHPGKAIQDKLAGGTACPYEVRYAIPESTVYTNWLEVWKKMVEDGTVEENPKATDEAAAKRAVCTSEQLTEADVAKPVFDACATPGGPWLIRHDGSWGGHWLYVVEPADGSQVRLTELGIAGGGRCGADSDAVLTGNIVTWNLREYAPIDVMEGKDGEIVDCEGDNVCFSACGEEVDASFIAYVFSPRTPDPTSIHGPQVAQGQPPMKVSVEGEQIVVQGNGCDLRVPLIAPPAPPKPDPAQ